MYENEHEIIFTPVITTQTITSLQPGSIMGHMTSLYTSLNGKDKKNPIKFEFSHSGKNDNNQFYITNNMIFATKVNYEQHLYHLNVGYRFNGQQYDSEIEIYLPHIEKTYEPTLIIFLEHEELDSIKKFHKNQLIGHFVSDEYAGSNAKYAFNDTEYKLVDTKKYKDNKKFEIKHGRYLVSKVNGVGKRKYTLRVKEKGATGKEISRTLKLHFNNMKVDSGKTLYVFSVMTKVIISIFLLGNLLVFIYFIRKRNKKHI